MTLNTRTTHTQKIVQERENYVTPTFLVTSSEGVDVFVSNKRWSQLARCRRVFWHVCVIYIVIPQEYKRWYISTRYCRTLGNIFQTIWTGSFSIIYISVVLIQETGLSTSSNTSNTSIGSGTLFMLTSLKRLVILVIFTEHGLTISIFITVTLIISRETEG